jgi:hypothetical protein
MNPFRAVSNAIKRQFYPARGIAPPPPPAPFPVEDMVRALEGRITRMEAEHASQLAEVRAETAALAERLARLEAPPAKPAPRRTRKEPDPQATVAD